jgi:hypothetical protein
MKTLNATEMRAVNGGKTCKKCGTTYAWTGWWLHFVGLCSGQMF